MVPAPPVHLRRGVERVLAAQELARSAMDEIREVIFELSSDGKIELPRALRDVIEDVEAGTRLEVGLRVYGKPSRCPPPPSTRSCRSHARGCSTWSAMPRPSTPGSRCGGSEGVSLAVGDDGGDLTACDQLHLFISPAITSG